MSDTKRNLLGEKAGITNGNRKLLKRDIDPLNNAMNIMEAKHEQESNTFENDNKINAVIWR